MLRRKLICVGVMLSATIAGLLVVPFVTAPRVTVRNYEKINNGMVLADVEALLGRPSAGPNPAVNYLFLCVSKLREDYATFEAADEALEWHDNGGRISVAFRAGGAVTFKRYDPPQKEPLLDGLRRWLRI